MARSSTSSGIFKVGDKFSSFDDVLAAIKLFEDEQLMSYWRRHTRLLDGAPKSTPKTNENAIKYYQVYYHCLKGGKKHKTCSKGLRPNQKTFRQDCESCVHFRASKDGQHLVVTYLNTTHNHECTEGAYAFIPKCRKLDEKETIEVNNILKTRPNKKILQDHIRSISGKKLTLRDIQNLQKRLKGTPGDLEEILNSLISERDATVEVVSDDTDMLRAIYYQDNIMKKKFNKYPELLIADATYKLNNLRMPVFLQIVVDGNGESEIVSVFLIVSEDQGTLEMLLEIFKKHNPAWTRTKTVLTDKDMTERAVFKNLMPDVRLQLCLFHVLKSMRREIHCEKMGIRIGEKNACLEIIQKIAYSKNEEEYTSNVDKLNNTRIQPVIDYYRHSWHDIRSEWVLGLKQSCHYGNNTSNRIESINQKLKQVVARFSNLENFFHDLKLVIACLRQERDSRIANVITKRLVHSHPAGSPAAMYMDLLTPVAYQLVIDQISLASKVRFQDVADNPVFVEMRTSHGVAMVSCETCTCKYVEFNSLPCRHIFALRRKRNHHLYTDTSVAERWKIRCYIDHSLQQYNCTTENVNDAEIPITQLGQQRRKTALSQPQKYKAAFGVAQRLATLASEGSMTKYKQRIKVLRDLVALWEQDSQAVAIEIDREEESSNVRSTERSVVSASSGSSCSIQRQQPSVVSASSGSSCSIQRQQPSVVSASSGSSSCSIQRQQPSVVSVSSGSSCSIQRQQPSVVSASSGSSCSIQRQQPSVVSASSGMIAVVFNDRYHR
ncbi:zinc finger SWIM domain-containing protein 3-like [Tubulanus polymorphus]|uniref:zinc finger SWIM domain-containing protein 3-like n=1 Tax=Tubulanus polymorphus TaxID=672921 RepID=UPI003DA4A953